MREIIMPTINGMAADGTPYTGFLYAGLMIDADGQPRTIEFNCRMGDPETQPIMMRMKSDLVDLLDHAVNGTLDRAEVSWDRRAALGVVIAAGGYPEEPRKGDPVTALPADADDCVVFHAGTQAVDGQLVTSGGRVLCVTALGDSVRSAQRRAYEAVAQVRFDGAQYRRDIGHRAIKPRG
jgi:phosphoribosylamine--glycine ligase